MADSLTPLENIVADTSAFMVSSSKGEEASRAGFQALEKSAQKVSEIYTTVADNKYLVELTKQNAELQAQSATRKAANAAGVDPSASIDALTTKLGQRKVVNQELDSAMNEVRSRTEGSGWDNLVGSFTLPGHVNRVRNLMGMSENLTKQIDDINRSVQQTAVTQRAIAETVTQSSAVASANLVAAEAKVAAEKAGMEAIKYGVDAVNVAKNSSKERLEMLYHEQNALMDEKKYQLAMDHLAVTKENLEGMREERRLAREAKAEGKGVDEHTLEMINVGRKSRGAQELSGLAAKTMLTLFKSGGAGSRELFIDYNNGFNTGKTGISMLGASPGETVAHLAQVSVDVPPAMEGTIALLDKARLAVKSNPVYANEKDPETIKQAINDWVRKEVERQSKKIVANDKDNIFNIGDLRSYLDLGAVKNLPVVSKVLAPLAVDKVDLSDPKIVLHLVSKAVLDGAITSTQAQELSSVYRLATQINMQARRVLSVGIVPPKTGRSYDAEFDYPAPMGFLRGTVDMTNPTQIGNQLSKTLANNIQNEMYKRGLRGGGPTGNLRKVFEE